MAGSSGELGGLLVVVGPGDRISTVDCSRVLNVNRSLYGSTSRGRAQRVVLQARPAVRGPDLYYRRDSCSHLISNSVGCVSACVRSVGTKKKLINIVPPRGRYWRSCCLILSSCLAGLSWGLWVGGLPALRAVWIPGFPGF